MSESAPSSNPRESELLELSLVELAGRLREKKASPVELMRDVMESVDAQNPLLNAIVAERDRDALMDEARAAERRIQRGEARPLEGIPLGVKDLEDAAGLITSHGSKLFADNLVDHHSVQVARLRDAGAIVYGKTNAPEFGCTAYTKNLVYGTTRSPWALDRTPGGSSGGSSCALAARMLPLVTASDGGGSVRLPACFTGAFGLKPSYGRIPTGPLHEWEHGATAVHGPLTKTVSDAALFLDQAAGHHPSDPRSLPAPDRSYADEVEKPIDAPATIGFSLDFGHAVVQSDVTETVGEAIRVFERMGHRVREVKTPPPDVAVDWALVGSFEIGGRIARFRPDRDGEVTRGLMQTVRMTETLTQQWWGRFSDRRVALVNWCAELFSEHDFFITPTAPYEAFDAKGPYPRETEGRQQTAASCGSFTIPFNLSWNPAASVRAGLSKSGLPLGMQIVGRHHREDLVLRLARDFEREQPWHPHWPSRAP